MRLFKFLIAAAVSKPGVNERGSCLIGRRTHFSSKRKGLWPKAQGIVVMREWAVGRMIIRACSVFHFK